MAVFTRITHDEVVHLLNNYSKTISSFLSFEGILQGIDNTNYKIETDKGHFILTIFEERINPHDIPFFLSYMKHMAEAGIVCPIPIAQDDGTNIGTVCGKPYALFPFLSGHGVEPNDISPTLCSELGALLGHMHRAGQSFALERPNSMSLDAWEMRITKVGAAANDVSQGLAGILTDEIQFLRQNWPQDLPKGGVHLDLFPDNVFINDGNICGVIDFYFAATEFLAYDLAIVMNAWCFRAGGTVFDVDCWRALYAAYHSVRPLNAIEKNVFSILARGAAMRFLASRLHDFVFHDPQNMVTPKDPQEYLKILQFHMSNGVF